MSGEFGALTVGFQTLHLREDVRCRARVSFVRRERAIGVRLCPAKPSLTWSTKKDQSNVSRDEPSGKSSNWATEPRELSGTDTQNTTPDPSSHIKSKNRISTRHVLPLNAMHETIRMNNKKLKRRTWQPCFRLSAATAFVHVPIGRNACWPKYIFNPIGVFEAS